MVRSEKCQTLRNYVNFMFNMISATVITLNEERDIARCLKSLSFADEIIVVDSGSTDKTVEIAKAMGAIVVPEPWRGYGAQKNFAMSLAKGEWVLNLDADEEVTKELRDEIFRKIKSRDQTNGYAIARKTYYLGKWIRFGGWYPNYVTRLVRKQKARWTEPNVHEELVCEGPVRRLENPMLHYTFEDITDQVRTNIRYARQGALDLYAKGTTPSRMKLFTKPLGKFFSTYFLKKGCLDGLPGFVISINAAHSIFLKYAYLLEMDLRNEDETL